METASRDRWLVRALCTLAAASGLIVVGIIGFLVAESAPALSTVGIGRFLTDESWHPAADAESGTFNLSPMLLGTLLTSAGAIALAAPLGVLSAAFTRFYAPRRLARWYRRMIALMAGVPSVVYGLWGLVVLVPLIARVEPPGSSLLAGVVILTLMILPTIALLADAAFAAVPTEYLHGAAALGLSRAATTFRVAVPAARSALVTAVILASARAVGETMAVLMVCGNVVRVPTSLFDPVRTLTAAIALEMDYARGDHRAALFVCGLVLLAMVVALIAAAELIDRRRFPDAKR
jgi:phosphate transport system permease protein